MAHGKQTGTTLTACGVIATSWSKEFDIAFPPESGLICGACLASIKSQPR